VCTCSGDGEAPRWAVCTCSGENKAPRWAVCTCSGDGEAPRWTVCTCSGDGEAPRWTVRFIVGERVVTQCLVLDEAFQLRRVDLIHFLLITTTQTHAYTHILVCVTKWGLIAKLPPSGTFFHFHFLALF